MTVIEIGRSIFIVVMLIFIYCLVIIAENNN